MVSPAFISSLIACILLPPSVLAAEPAGSSVGLALDVGTHDYRDLDLDGKIAVSPQYRILLGAEHSKAESVGVTGRLRMGGDANISEDVLVRAGVSVGNEPNDVKSAGVNVGGDGVISELWHAERETLLSVDYALTSFRQRIPPTDTSKRLASRFRQQSWTFGLNQEVTESLSMDGFISRYSYSGATGNDVNLAVDRRRARLENWENTVQGFAQNSFGFGLAYRLDEKWKPGLSYAHSRVVFANAQADTFGGSLECDYSKQWEFSVRGSRTKQEYEDPSLIGGFTVSYHF